MRAVSRKNWPAVWASWGLALILCGQVLGWELRGAAAAEKNILFPAIPIFIGLIFLVRPSWLFRARLSADPMLLAAPLLLLLLPCAVISLVNTELLREQLAYLLMLCCLTVLIGLHERRDFDQLPLAIVVVGGCGCLISLAELATTPMRDFVRLAVAGNNNPMAMATNGTFTTLAAVVVGFSSGRNRLWVGAGAALAFVAGLINVVLSLTRSEIVAVLLCLTFYMALRRHIVRPLHQPTFRRSLGFWAFTALTLVSIPAAAAALFSPAFLASMLGFVQDRLGNFLVLATGGGHLDTSSSLHTYFLQYNWAHLDALGHGIMDQTQRQGAGIYAHNAYIQAVYDFGIVGGLCFTVLGLVLPLSLIVLRMASGPLSATEGLVTLFFVRVLIDRVSHGTPYDWVPWLSTLLIYLWFQPRTGLAFPLLTAPRQGPRHATVAPIPGGENAEAGNVPLLRG